MSALYCLLQTPILNSSSAPLTTVAPAGRAHTDLDNNNVARVHSKPQSSSSSPPPPAFEQGFSPPGVEDWDYADKTLPRTLSRRSDRASDVMNTTV